MVIINNLTELEDFAKNYASKLKRNTILGLIGELGTGKTQFTKFLVKYLGSNVNEVTSPTFTILNEYLCKNQLKIFHFDLYRLKTIEELEEIGYEEFFFSNNICIIEWIDNIPECLEFTTNLIKIEYINDKTRKLLILK
jgi:tRNA threonylcarbamoyladenosine biosynthesis protein TsaE